MTSQIRSESNFIDIIQPYIEAHGSARLVNCIRVAVEGRYIPYQTLDDYFADPLELRVQKLIRIPNLGKKTAREFNEIVVNILGSQNLVAVDGVTSTLDRSEDGGPETLVGNACKPEPILEDRYSGLTPREKDIIERRFGIGRNDKQTLDEIAQVYCVTRERIRQLQNKALKKMRAAYIVAAWKLFINENKDRLLDAIFGGEPLIKEPGGLSDELALAVEVVYGSTMKFLESDAQRFENYWVKSNLNKVEIQTARNRIATIVDKEGIVPLSVREAAEALEVSRVVVTAAVAALDGYKIYSGWIIEGMASSRKRRIVNILNLFSECHIISPASLWNIQVAYWREYVDDKCTGRDLLLCLQEHTSHFINLRELGWVFLTSEANDKICDSRLLELQGDIPGELYTKPVKTGHGLANSVYEVFEGHGPLRLADAADIFQREHPEYKISSMYPMLVYFPVFLRFAPGILGIQGHRHDSDAIQSARKIMLQEHDLDLYLLSRAAGAPSVRYPLWDMQMENLWANWLAQRRDATRLGALLSVAKFDDWDVTEAEKYKWQAKKEELNGRGDVPALRIFTDRRIDTGMLTTALAASSVFGCANWMFLNQALGWRVETTRVGVILAVLVHMGVLRPTGSWSETHLLTIRGRQLSQTIFGRSIGRTAEFRKTMAEALEESVEPSTDIGWAEAYEFEQLRQQITDVAGESEETPITYDGEDPDIEVGYEGFMGDELRRLIEGE